MWKKKATEDHPLLVQYNVYCRRTLAAASFDTAPMLCGFKQDKQTDETGMVSCVWIIYMLLLQMPFGRLGYWDVTSKIRFWGSLAPTRTDFRKTHKTSWE